MLCLVLQLPCMTEHLQMWAVDRGLEIMILHACKEFVNCHLEISCVLQPTSIIFVFQFLCVAACMYNFCVPIFVCCSLHV